MRERCKLLRIPYFHVSLFAQTLRLVFLNVLLRPGPSLLGRARQETRRRGETEARARQERSQRQSGRRTKACWWCTSPARVFVVLCVFGGFGFDVVRSCVCVLCALFHNPYLCTLPWLWSFCLSDRFALIGVGLFFAQQCDVLLANLDVWSLSSLRFACYVLVFSFSIIWTFVRLLAFVIVSFFLFVCAALCFVGRLSNEQRKAKKKPKKARRCCCSGWKSVHRVCVCVCGLLLMYSVYVVCVCVCCVCIHHVCMFIVCVAFLCVEDEPDDEFLEKLTRYCHCCMLFCCRSPQSEADAFVFDCLCATKTRKQHVNTRNTANTAKTRKTTGLCFFVLFLSFCVFSCCFTHQR